MRAARLREQGDIEGGPLTIEEIDRPSPGPGELLIDVSLCGVCHTDLHEAEGDITPETMPITPGHQVVGVVAQMGQGVSGWTRGDRVGIPWLYSSCGDCERCRSGQENLCPQAKFTGFDVDGGFAEYMVSRADYTLPLPSSISDRQAAPLLCAGIIGFRSLHQADLKRGEVLGLVGFGASAHLAIQVALHWDCEVYVFTRSPSHREMARDMGAGWVGGAEGDPPRPLDRAVIFAPAGQLVPKILEKIRPGGTLAINAIHMSPIPEMPYRLIYMERTLRSVANATYQDGLDFLQIAAEIPIEPSTVTYPLDQINQALKDIKHSNIDGAAVVEL